ncbi:MAG TPA: sigma-70 family RNA polymerase sigma factor [Myxococcaceae bacterium]|nr:sigma-70 family RNA polymerase sigma factor [Myxococcaceae bacterium]
MRSPSPKSEDELFLEILHRRAEGEDVRPALGELVELWREPARTVVRRVQASYRRGSPDDAEDVFQDAVQKLIARGLDQFRGLSEQVPGKAASPKTFFLRIVKHVAIDRYRRSREDLAHATAGGEDEALAASAPQSAHEVARAVEAAEGARRREEAREEYRAAFERLRREHPNEAAAWDLYHHQDVDDHGEVARLMGITVANSYKRVSRAQAWLKLYLLEQRREEEQE